MSFQWPWHFDFPPFFTIQPNLSTRDKQLKAWGRLVLDYCQANRIYTTDFEELAKSDLFNNRRLNRHLDQAGIRAVFDFLELQKHVEWKDKAKSRCNIYWRRPEEWGQLLYEWANSIGLLNTVVTLYELTQGEDVVQESFYGLDKDVLLRGLQHLEDQGKAVLIDIEGSNFLRNCDTVEEGDTAVVYVNAGTQYSIVVKRGHTLHMKYGALRHEFLIGKRYGTAVSASAGYVFVLRANPHMWTRTLQKSTQILYTPDIGTILLLLNVKPGARICETGTGSGSLSHAIATAVAPDGHLYSFDIDEQRVKMVQNDLKLHGLSQFATVQCRDVCQHGFELPSPTDRPEEVVAWCCDGVFLDLPAPWLAIGHARKVLLQDGAERRPSRLVSFSPCIEQVQRVCIELEQHGFVDIETVEVVPQKLKVVDTLCESLTEFAAKGANAQAFFRHAQEDSADHQSKGRRGSKRKADSAGTERRVADDQNGNDEDGIASCENDQNGKMGALDEDSNANGPAAMLTDAVPCPLVQPTHTGYITSATLLPRINHSPPLAVNDDTANVVCSSQKLSPLPQQQ